MIQVPVPEVPDEEDDPGFFYHFETRQEMMEWAYRNGYGVLWVFEGYVLVYFRKPNRSFDSTPSMLRHNPLVGLRNPEETYPPEAFDEEGFLWNPYNIEGSEVSSRTDRVYCWKCKRMILDSQSDSWESVLDRGTIMKTGVCDRCFFRIKAHFPSFTGSRYLRDEPLPGRLGEAR